MSPPAIATALRKILKDNPFNQKIELNQLALSATSLLCVALWILLFVETGTTWLSPSTKFFLLAGLATALGSTTRNIVRCYFDQEVKFSLGRFVTEFVLGVVVAFVFFLLMQLGGVIVSGSTVPLDMKDLPQFQRLVTATSLLCFAASYLIESSLDRLRSKLTRVLDETGPSQ